MVYGSDTALIDHYYAPNVGRIRSDYYSDDLMYIREDRVLQEYKVN